ncbi:hypothetical protein A6A08_06720 [Nocardiopsis sp. TSRI0078]|uniref:hypothetical protein n=1 Tax=unclassified Nocardiopsis TaxID=2649073 RepID=UPI00093D10F5|nr:hypothetical protein [Nocardiopsis sp. TSRI0078]OKI16960.1 hypothetical protein A6A08_06720 [Nocardiopsis sp. TSRI0078]
MDSPDGEGTAVEAQHGPHEDDSAEESAAAPPADLFLHKELGPLLGRVLVTYARRLWALLVVAALPAVPVTLLSQALVVAPARDGAYLNGVLESAANPLAPALVVATGVVALLGLAVAPFALGGSVLLGTAALLGRRISPRQAWQGARRRYFTVLTWLLLLLVLVASSLALYLWAVASDWPPVVTELLVLGPLMAVLVPLTVSLPLGLVEGHGPFRALLEACRLARHRFIIHLTLVSLSYGVSVLAGTGLEWALPRWTDLADGSSALSAITLLTSLVVAPLSLLLGCAPVAYCDFESPYTAPGQDRAPGGLASSTPGGARYVVQPTVRDVDLVRAGEHLPAPAASVSGRSSDSAFTGPRLVLVPALALVVFGPPLLGPGLLAANPFGLPEMDAHPVASINSDELSVSLEPTGEGALVGAATSYVNLEVCAPQCRVVAEGERSWMGDGVRIVDGGALWTVWREYEHEDAEEEANRYAPHPDSGLYLLSCADIADCETPDQETLVRPYPENQHHVASAVTPLADGRLLVASSVKRYDPPELGVSLEQDRGGLRLHLCEDTSCADPKVVLFPPEMAAGGFLTDGEFLAPAAYPGGGYAIAVTDTARGSLSLVACAERACTDPETTQIHGDRFYSEHDSRLRSRFGARVELRSDGTPVLAYRDPQGGRAHLVDCHDALCSEFTDTAVTGPGWARPVPGLAVDSRDRAHLLTPDFAQERLVLLSCLDRSCSQASSAPLLELTEAEPGLTALVLDDQDRPHMLWGQGEFVPGYTGGELEAEAQYLRCLEPLCGAGR